MTLFIGHQKGAEQTENKIRRRVPVFQQGLDKLYRPVIKQHTKNSTIR